MALEPEKTHYEQVIDTFTFDDQCSIKIPKSVREVAFDLSVDIVIKSVARVPYKNYKILPETSFYGYCVIVLEDMTEIHQIIEQPRQRLYYYRVHEAFAQWHNYLTADFLARIIRQTQDLICNVSSILGSSCVDTPCEAPPEFEFVEVPIREVYIECPYGTSFELEVSFTKARPFTNLCDGTFAPVSGMTDGSKDAGLPSSGMQPVVAPDPNNPFNGTTPPSTSAELGGFYNGGKEESIGLSDPNNSLFQPVQWDVTFTNACGESVVTRVTYGYGVVPSKIVVHPSYPYGSDVNTCANGSTAITPGPSYGISLNGSADILNTPYGGGWRNITFSKVG